MSGGDLTDVPAGTRFVSGGMHGGARDQTLATPWSWLRRVEESIGVPFDLDPCCEEHTSKAPKFYTVETDGLRSPWFGVVWVNPPFNAIGEWVAKALREVDLGRAHAVVFVVPANRSDRPWWQTLRRMEHDGLAWSAYPATRIAYEGGPSTPPFPSMFWAFGDASIASRIRRLDGAGAQTDLFGGNT